MEQEQIAEILSQLANHEARLKTLEGIKKSVLSSATPSVGGKQKTLRELVKGRKFRSGQEQVAAIVAYHEKVIGKNIEKGKIKEEWENAKMNGKFSAMFFSRAKDVFIRVHTDNTCDLTQTGEEFFDNLLSNESIDTSSK